MREDINYEISCNVKNLEVETLNASQEQAAEVAEREKAELIQTVEQDRQAMEEEEKVWCGGSEFQLCNYYGIPRGEGGT